MSDAISRREMAALLVAGLGVMAGGSRMSEAQSVSLARPSDQALVEFLNRNLDDADFGVVAAEWRRRHPEETSRDSLVARLLSNRSPNESIDVLVARKVAEEHAGESAVVIDGWFLAPTEVRLIALLDLIRGRG